MTTTMKALNAGLSMEGVTMYLFWLSTVAMGAGMFYFWLQRKTVPVQYQTAVTVAGIICAVAAFHYWRMSGIYLEGVASLFNEDGSRIPGATIKQFPTAYRYIDWLITVPLLVLEFPLLLNLGKAGRELFKSLLFWSIAMLVTAWVAEESVTGSQQWWTWYAVHQGHRGHEDRSRKYSRKLEVHAHVRAGRLGNLPNRFLDGSQWRQW
jgi:bacteriorhodopsin